MNRAVLLKTVDSEVDSFDRGLSTLHDLSAKLVAAQDEVNSTQKSLVDIQKIYLRLAHISELNPLLHHYFQETDALDISKKLNRRSERSARQFGIGRSASILGSPPSRTRGNLSTNKNTISGTDCDLSGRYSYFFKDAEWTPQLIFDIKKSGNGYSCATITHPTCTCTIISASPVTRSLIQKLGGARSGAPQYTYTIAADYRRMDSPDGVSLRLQ